MATKHFTNKVGYEKWLAYGHIHHVFEDTPGEQKIIIGGVKHRVRHEP